MTEAQPDQTRQDALDDTVTGPASQSTMPTASGAENAPQGPQEPNAAGEPETPEELTARLSEEAYAASPDPTTARLAYTVVGLWDGKWPLYQCKHCPWNTTGGLIDGREGPAEAVARDHFINTHLGELARQPAPPTLVDTSGEPLTSGGEPTP